MCTRTHRDSFGACERCNFFLCDARPPLCGQVHQYRFTKLWILRIFFFRSLRSFFWHWQRNIKIEKREKKRQRRRRKKQNTGYSSWPSTMKLYIFFLFLFCVWIWWHYSQNISVQRMQSNDRDSNAQVAVLSLFLWRFFFLNAFDGFGSVWLRTIDIWSLIFV